MHPWFAGGIIIKSNHKENRGKQKMQKVKEIIAGRKGGWTHEYSQNDAQYFYCFHDLSPFINACYTHYITLTSAFQYFFYVVTKKRKKHFPWERFNLYIQKAAQGGKKIADEISDDHWKPNKRDEIHNNTWDWTSVVQALGLLVSVSSMHYCTYTSDLSNS